MAVFLCVHIVYTCQSYIVYSCCITAPLAHPAPERGFSIDQIFSDFWYYQGFPWWWDMVFSTIFMFRVGVRSLKYTKNHLKIDGKS